MPRHPNTFAGAMDPLAAFTALGVPPMVGPSAGTVAGCGASDPLSYDPNSADAQAKYQKLQQRALLDMAPQIALGFTASASPVVPGAFTATLTAPVPVRITRIEHPASTAPFFTYSSIKVGLCDVIAVGSVSAEAFTANSNAPPFEMGVAGPGMPVTITGSNIDVANHRADISAYGINLKSEWGSLCEGC